jgi:hypothetical protein
MQELLNIILGAHLFQVHILVKRDLHQEKQIPIARVIGKPDKFFVMKCTKF